MNAGGLLLAVQYAQGNSDAPAEDFIENCVQLALPGLTGELTVRIVDEAESAALNERYRKRQGPTNVLAFPGSEVGLPEPQLIGDIVICAPVIAREAGEQGKSLSAHWAHMIVHGCLHLAGLSHDGESDAVRMEARERELLHELGYPDPYPDEA